MDSILVSVKKILGITSTYTHFDADLIIHINTVLGILNQLGVGPENGFFIVDDRDKWTDFLGEDEQLLEAVKSFVALKVRMMFDPPTTSAVSNSIDNVLKELEFRINVMVDPKEA